MSWAAHILLQIRQRIMPLLESEYLGRESYGNISDILQGYERIDPQAPNGGGGGRFCLWSKSRSKRPRIHRKPGD
jgi:hypothetical protein